MCVSGAPKTRLGQGATAGQPIVYEYRLGGIESGPPLRVCPAQIPGHLYYSYRCADSKVTRELGT